MSWEVFVGDVDIGDDVTCGTENLGYSLTGDEVIETELDLWRRGISIKELDCIELELDGWERLDCWLAVEDFLLSAVLVGPWAVKDTKRGDEGWEARG